MCIAIVKPKGIETPSEKLLKTCWNNNPDGAGFCYNTKNGVIIHKGYLKFEDFYKDFKKHNYKNCDLIIHFRIATHGGVNKECTHPFVISKNIEDLKKLHVKCKSAFVHNGIISGYGSRTDNGVSDTMDYVTKIIANIPYINKTLLDNLAKEKSSRFAIINKNNFVVGGAWIKDNGIYYSNDSYKERVVETPKATKKCTSHFSYTSKTCDFCGQKTYIPRYVWDTRYGEYYTLCGDCYKFAESYINK